MKMKRNYKLAILAIGIPLGALLVNKVPLLLIGPTALGCSAALTVACGGHLDPDEQES
jgi:hypothetical protein